MGPELGLNIVPTMEMLLGVGWKSFVGYLESRLKLECVYLEIQWGVSRNGMKLDAGVFRNDWQQ